MLQRKFLNVIVILISSTLLFACDGGGGGGSDAVIDKATQNTDELGSVTISGTDIGAGEGVLNPDTFTLAGQGLVFRTWVSSTLSPPPLALIVGFNLDGTISITSLTLSNAQAVSNREYMCSKTVLTCTGITHDSSKKSVTFNNAVLEPISTLTDGATEPVTLNGTLKYTE